MSCSQTKDDQIKNEDKAMKKIAKLLSITIILAMVCTMTACNGSGGGSGTGNVTPSPSQIALRTVWEDFLKSNNETELYYLPSDYDGNGKEEAYGITGKGYEDGFANNVKIYFIDSSGKISCVKDKTYSGDSLFGELQNQDKLSSDPEKVFLKAGNQKFIVWEIDGGGSASVSVVFGVRNGSSYQPNISGKYQYFHCTSDNVYVGTTSDFSQGYHQYIDVTFSFNASTGEFEKK